MTSIERACRALCRLAGHPENITFEGRPMWESYRDEAQAVLDAVRHEELRDIAQRVTGWKEQDDRGPDSKGMRKLKTDAAAVLK